jgi:outer membrane protein OmpA-like peptidoglycan-associated protein
MDPDNAASVLHYRKKGIDITLERGTSDQSAKGAEGRHPEVKTIIENAATPTSGGSILFEKGKSDLSDGSREVIAKLVPVLTGHNAVLLVKGHVSGDEISARPDDPFGISLSQRRANAVAEELIRKGIDRKLLRPVACGPYEPTRSGSYDKEDIANNRRVEVFSTNTLISEYHPSNTVQLDPARSESPAKTPKRPASSPREESDSPGAPSAKPEAEHH